MGEANINAEVAAHLREHGSRDHAGGADDGHKLRHELIEIFEAVLLALVAIVTAWSGYQAARWDGKSAREYAASSRLRAESVQLSLSNGQTILYDTSNLNSWFQAMEAGDKELADFVVSRFTPEYRTAFDAWIKLDPLHDPTAPRGPRFMPEFKDPLAEKATLLGDQATAAFESGATNRETGERYVRLTVILAAVLFLIAVGQRFRVRAVRIGVSATASVFLIYALVLALTYKRA